MPDLAPKPAYRAVQILTSELAGFRIVARRDTGRDEDFVLVLSDAAGRTKLAAWTTAEPRTVRLDVEPVPPASVVVIGMSGRRTNAIVRSQRLILELGPEPQYVDLGRASLKVR
jgi:hypothetical protein